MCINDSSSFFFFNRCDDYLIFPSQCVSDSTPSLSEAAKDHEAVRSAVAGKAPALIARNRGDRRRMGHVARTSLLFLQTSRRLSTRLLDSLLRLLGSSLLPSLLLIPPPSPSGSRSLRFSSCGEPKVPPQMRRCSFVRITLVRGVDVISELICAMPLIIRFFLPRLIAFSAQQHSASCGHVTANDAE